MRKSVDDILGMVGETINHYPILAQYPCLTTMFHDYSGFDRFQRVCCAAWELDQSRITDLSLCQMKFILHFVAFYSYLMLQPERISDSEFDAKILSVRNKCEIDDDIREEVVGVLKLYYEHEPGSCMFDTKETITRPDVGFKVRPIGTKIDCVSTMLDSKIDELNEVKNFWKNFCGEPKMAVAN